MWESILNFIGIVNAIWGIVNIGYSFANWRFKKEKESFKKQIEKEREAAFKANKEICDICRSRSAEHIKDLRKQIKPALRG